MQRKTTLKDGQIICVRRLWVLPIRDLPAARYGELREFFQKIEVAEQGKVVMVEKT